MQARPNVFISATTADLGSYRLAVRDTLLDQGCIPSSRITLSLTADIAGHLASGDQCL